MEKNIEQEKAIAQLEGPVILISCPGSGKTTTLLRRINHMLEEGISPEKILMITFTKAAAQEMAEKFRKKFGEPGGITFSTIHALCLRILISYGGLSVDNIMKTSDQWLFLLNTAKKCKNVNDPAKAAGQFQTLYSAAMNNRINPAEIKPEEIKGMTREDFLFMSEQYSAMKVETGYIDFDDMLVKAYELLTEEPKVLSLLRDKWDYIQVDEYQDVNYLQRNLVYLLAGDKRNICVAGDDDQSIYRFRGAKPEIMLNFPKDFPDAHVFCISTNYRSFPGIIGCAGKLIEFNKNRYSKQFLSGQTGDAKIRVLGEESSDFQMDDIAKDVKNCGYAFHDSAVLYRNNKQAEQIADKFDEENIPYYCTETIPDSYEHWIWYDILAYYRLSRGIEKSSDFSRVADRPQRYMGKILRTSKGRKKEDLLETASKLYSGWKLSNIRTNIYGYFRDIQILGDKRPEKFLSYILKDMGYENYLRKYSESINQDFDEMERTLSLYRKDSRRFSTMEEWLLYIKKRSMNMNKNSDQGVCLSTMHRSKGLEWKNVYIIDCNEGYVPPKVVSSEDVEEERRLFYVAVTRAKERLYITYVRNKKNKPVSRFISELQLSNDQVEKAKTIKKNDLVRHKLYGNCIVLSVNNNKCKIHALTSGKEAEVLISSINA